MKPLRRTAAFAALAVLLSSCAGLPGRGPRPALGASAWRLELETGDRALRHARLAEAESALTDALAKAEGWGPEDERLAQALDAMADLRSAQGRPAAAESYGRRALAIWEKSAGPDSPPAAAALAYLAEACAAQGKTREAEKLLTRALEAALKDPARPREAAARLSDLAALDRSLGRDDRAEADDRRALELVQVAFGPDSREAADRLNDLALFEHSRGRYDAAEPLYRRALEIKEKRLGPESSEVLEALNDLALFYEAAGKDADAEAAYRRAIELSERTHDAAAPSLTATLNHYAHLVRRLGRGPEADALEARARALGAPKEAAAP